MRLVFLLMVRAVVRVLVAAGEGRVAQAWAVHACGNLSENQMGSVSDNPRGSVAGGPPESASGGLLGSVSDNSRGSVAGDSSGSVSGGLLGSVSGYLRGSAAGKALRKAARNWLDCLFGRSPAGAAEGEVWQAVDVLRGTTRERQLVDVSG